MQVIKSNPNPTQTRIAIALPPMLNPTCIVGWMDGWMDGWMEGRREGVTEGGRNGLMDGRKVVWMEGWMDE